MLYPPSSVVGCTATMVPAYSNTAPSGAAHWSSTGTFVPPATAGRCLLGLGQRLLRAHVRLGREGLLLGLLPDLLSEMVRVGGVIVIRMCTILIISGYTG